MANITNKKIYVIEFSKRNYVGRVFVVTLKNIHKLKFHDWMNLKGTGREFYTTKEEVLKHVGKLEKEDISFEVSIN